MKVIWAIALQALRLTFRSRIVLVLALLLGAAICLLPATIRSDGTPAGLIHLHLAYTLGSASFLLTLATLWAGCAAIAQEADDKTLQLLLAKPVPRTHVWLGKWLALLLLNALLLALAGSTSALTLRYKLRHGGFAPEDLAQAHATTLTALATTTAPLPDITADVEAEYTHLRARRALPPDAPPAVVRDSIRRTRLAQLYSLPAGTTRSWSFPQPPAATRQLVQFSCDSSIPGAVEIQGTVRLHSGDYTASRDFSAMAGTPQTIIFDNVPAAAVITVDVVNRAPANSTLFFEPAAGLTLRTPVGAFAGNYLRALALLFLRLALFAAIGVTLGTLFSLPVASFLALVLILVLQLSGFVSSAAQTDRATFVANVAQFGGGHAHDDAAPAPSLLARGVANVLYVTYRGTWYALRPLLDDHTLDQLATGTHLPPRHVLRALLVQGLGLPALLALIATAVLKTREWALPNST